MDERVEELTNMFKDRPWFHSVGYEQYGRVVVYVNYACHETLHDIPDSCQGKQVLVHFAASQFAKAEQFKTNPTSQTAPAPKLEIVPDEGDDLEELPSSFLELDLDDLCKRLDKLEKICGSNCLQDIFYEVHDNRLTSGRNTVTNLSAKYPEVRDAMEILYDEYGFDVIYEEMDG
jgi:hypothetical protein